jgi:hypothetical protein
MKKLNLLVMCAAILSISAALAFAETAKAKNLFRIERNLNANVVMYDAVIDDNGVINAKTPVDAYWLLLAKDGSREKLTVFQKQAYGFSVKPLENGEYQLILRAVKQKPIRIVLINGEPKGILKINDKDAYLSKVYVFANPSGLSVKYYTIYGNDIKTGEALEEKVNND